MSKRRDHVLGVLHALCSKKRLPSVMQLNDVVGSLWCNKLVWKGPVEETMKIDYATHYERNSNMVGVLFRRHATVVFFCEAVATELPVDKFGDSYSVRLKYYDCKMKREGCLLHVTEMGPEEMVFETTTGETLSVLEAVQRDTW